ncbi:hypothetical protein G7Y89_g10767 [Cudoniella acicularis]|uniref:BZIP domain-containing protein n=1 Tax=Cudoniella acicularis TaxID=354080 RepID=A0A8H4VYG2_9HELO|nr:hypothetical protein G7Y89_g10767 [Cudoniella acicularis]
MESKKNSKPQKGSTRGRPKKESSSPAVEHQRARVRRAQEAYRRRKEARASAVEQKCKDLEAIVEEMTNTFVGFSDRLVNSGKLNDGVMHDLKNTLGRFLELGRSAAKKVDNDLGEDEDNEEHEDEEMSLGNVLDDAPVEEFIWHSCPASGTPQQNVLANSALLPNDNFMSFVPGAQSQAISQHAYAGAFDPYLNNAVWSPISPRTDNSIIPYLVAGRDSFASRLYYETINHGVRSLRGDAPWDFAGSMFRFKLQYAGRDTLLKVLAGVMNMLLSGTNQIQDGQPEVDGGGLVKAAIVRQVVEKGGRESDYLSTLEVEKYLTDRWGLVINSNAIKFQQRRGHSAWSAVPSILAGADRGAKSNDHAILSAPTMIPGSCQHANSIFNAPPLIERIKLAAVTIGEGPRWHRNDIDEAVGRFLEQNLVSRTQESPFLDDILRKSHNST